MFGQKRKKVGEGPPTSAPIRQTGGPDVAAMLAKAKAELRALEEKPKAKTQSKEPLFRDDDFCSC